MDELLLTRAEVCALTHRTQPAAQCRWLMRAGWKFVRDADGYPVVARDEFLRNMIGAAEASAAAPSPRDDSFEVNVEALQRVRRVA